MNKNVGIYCIQACEFLPFFNQRLKGLHTLKSDKKKHDIMFSFISDELNPKLKELGFDGRFGVTEDFEFMIQANTEDSYANLVTYLTKFDLQDNLVFVSDEVDHSECPCCAAN
jgi:hypothetical protein